MPERTEAAVGMEAAVVAVVFDMVRRCVVRWAILRCANLQPLFPERKDESRTWPHFGRLTASGRQAVREARPGPGCATSQPNGVRTEPAKTPSVPIYWSERRDLTAR